MTKLRYGNTNTWFVRGEQGGLLIDTDYAGTLPSFYKAIKQQQIGVQDITYVLATHYHPDHMGLVSELMGLGVRLLLLEVQRESVHFSDELFKRDRRLSYEPIVEERAVIIRCEESRVFLAKLGIAGEIVSTPSHSKDSVSVLLDDGACFVGDLEPREYLAAYESNPALEADWELVLRHRPRRICYAHAKEELL